MKIRSLSPLEAICLGEITDVEVELTVAKVNCILSREFGGQPVNIPCATIESGSTAAVVNVLNRFKQQGWIVTFLPRSSGVIRNDFYVFTPNPS